jgi:hypothetical protein
MTGLRLLLAGVGLLWAAAAQAAPDMRFRLLPYGSAAECARNCPLVVVADGEIRSDTPAKFRAFVESHRHNPRFHSVVILHSPGGVVEASMMLGRMFRATNMLAIVARPVKSAQGGGARLAAGRCYSACVYALMGATKRIVPPQSSVGIHRMHLDERGRGALAGVPARRVYGTPEWVQRLSDYAAQMGISRDLIATAETIEPERIRILTQAELQRWRLAQPAYE